MPLPPNRVDYLPIIDRPAIKWPNEARVALWISPYPRSTEGGRVAGS